MKREVALIAALLTAATVLVVAWTARNGLPDGYQNEFLHVGNALDLWQAAVDGDRWSLGYLLSQNYWPPLFYLAPWPLFAAMGAGHLAMLLTNVLHLAVLLFAVVRLGEDVRDRATGWLAAALILGFPGVTGNLVRFEPNVALMAWTTVGALALVRARGFSDRRWSVVFGVACGVGLLMDRIGLALFLALPALAELVAGLRAGDRRLRLQRAALGVGALLLVCGWWYLQFAEHHAAEILSQGGVGEIDSAGEWTEQRDPGALSTWGLYLGILLDDQAGLLPGAAAVLAILATLPLASGRRRVPLLVVLVGLGVFTLIAKKQVYYTLPMLGCVAVLLADRVRSLGPASPVIAGVLVLAGAHQIGFRMWGRGLPLGSLSEPLGGHVLPAQWADQDHPQARPPRDLTLPIDAVVSSLGPGEVVVFSEDQTWYEGFVVLQVRERLPGRRIRGLIVDPQGTYEWARTAGSVVHVSASTAGWPRREQMEAVLEQHHYELQHLPPVIEVIEELEPRFRLHRAWSLPTGGTVSVFLPG